MRNVADLEYIRKRYRSRTAITTIAVLGVIGIVSLVAAASLTQSGISDADRDSVSFIIAPGDGLGEISSTLKKEEVIRSEVLFKLYSVLTGAAGRLKPGAYEVFSGVSVAELVRTIVAGDTNEITVTVPEGATVVQIDSLLSNAGIIPSGSLIAYHRSKEPIEGYLFPDTYRFFPATNVGKIVEKMKSSFEEKALPILREDEENMMRNLILASILEKEVPVYEDRQIVAGLLLKRLSIGMPLQVDATVCYIKEARTQEKCYPLRRSDFGIESQYNTYVTKGLPPAPISNPGLAAIRAALNERTSPYWYYLSDPETKKTVFSSTLDEHNRNRVKYLSM